MKFCHFKMQEILFLCLCSKNREFAKNSIPKCSPFDNYDEDFFKKISPVTTLERILQQFAMIFSRFGSEGGLFIFIGKKK